MLDGVKILPAEAVKHAAPELCVPADAVVRVGTELAAAMVHPFFAGLIAQMLPDGFGIPVLVFLRNEVAALDDQDARVGV
jgi:hypothetical protein